MDVTQTVVFHVLKHGPKNHYVSLNEFAFFFRLDHLSFVARVSGFVYFLSSMNDIEHKMTNGKLDGVSVLYIFHRRFRHCHCRSAVDTFSEPCIEMKC